MDVEIYTRNFPAYKGVDFVENVKCLTETFSIRFSITDNESIEGYSLAIKPGWLFDGASIPRFLWRVCGHPWASPRDAAALTHDWLYATKSLPRKTADKIYRAIQIEMGIAKWKANLEYRALRLFGGWAWDGHDEEDAEIAHLHGVLKRFWH